MKPVLTFTALIATLFGPLYAISSEEKEAAFQVIQRFAGSEKIAVTLSSLEKEGGKDAFETSWKNKSLEVRGSSGVALCRGFYDFIRSQKAGISSWSGNRLQWPVHVPEGWSRKVVSPFRFHYYYNPVTYGYTLPYWGWEQWQKEIDWMALHGINMPLALVANEAISARVWKKLGLTDEEIAAYFVGPAHFPWMRMGNISGIDAPLPQEWHQDQIALQHKILKRMKSLGMKPICPGFAGFVPQAMKRVFPDVNLVETHWGGRFKNWMVSPDQELFSRIGTMFIQEWEKEFGKQGYYLADSFNEMEVPFPPKGTKERYDLLSSYGEKLYKSIEAANPDAVWVMQGWMFGYQRNIWEPATLQALLSKVPDDKMLLLDEAVDYNMNYWRNGSNWDFHKGFYNKPWIYGTIPNMGGKSGLTGVLSFYANGQLEALNSPNKGRLEGYGMAPEGTENNEVIYELCCDAGWSDKKIDLNEWLMGYSASRYGKAPAALKATWDDLQMSVYGSFTDHPRYNWQFRPGQVKKGSINANEKMYRAIEKFAGLSDQLGGSPLYRVDLAEWTAAYVGGKMEILVQAIENAYLYDDRKKADRLEKQFFALALGIDRALVSHPTARLERWIGFARKHGETKPLKDYYEKNARRIVTIWGPPVDDYSARIWSGIIRDYYVPRWKQYFESKKTGKALDLAKWELDWVENKIGLSPAAPYPDIVAACKKLIREASVINDSLIQATNGEVVGAWSPETIASEWKEVSWTIPVALVKRMKGVRFQYVRGTNRLDISEVSMVMDGKVACRVKQDGTTGTTNTNNYYALKIPADATGNNSCELKARMKSDGGTHSFGHVLLIPKE